TPTGEKTILFAGGRNADAYKKIRGLSIGMWIATEINLHHPTMIREAFSRQLAAKERKIFWDLNPEAPGAPIYRDFLDRYERGSADGTFDAHFYNHAHFTIFDNLSIPEERIREIIAQYEPGSLWYRRDIEGQRCAAEGMVYPHFADDPDAYLIRREEVGTLAFITVGVDFGGNRSKTTFVAVGFSPGFTRMTALRDGKLDNSRGEVTSEDVNAACEAFLSGVADAYPGVPIRYLFCDSEAQYLIHGLKRALNRRRTISGPVTRTNVSIPAVVNAKKTPITERIFCESSLFAGGRLKIVSDCSLLIAGLSSAVWDGNVSSGKDVRLDNFTSDIDILDAFEYAFEGYMKKFTE
ncbi:MAG: PBSX family phage terminase large subunit, partial [Eubacteriales bacterium]